MNIYNYSECGKCVHQEVCQYKEQQKDVLEKMNTRLDNSCAPSIFKFSFECQQYQPPKTVKSSYDHLMLKRSNKYENIQNNKEGR